MTSFIVPNRINGLDLCSIQDSIPLDAKRIKDAGFDFVYVKSSQYSQTRDIRFSSLTDRLSKAGLRVGAYHFCAHDSDPEAQAEFFYKASGGLGKNAGELPPMVDWEFCTPSKYKNHPLHCVEWLEKFLTKATQLWYPENHARRITRLPVVYSFPDYCNRHQPALGLSGTLSQFPFCLASYRRGRELPGEDHQTYHSVPKPWQRAILTQYSGNDGMPVPGIAGACDRQLFNGSSGEYYDFLGLERPVDLIEGDVKVDTATL